MANPLKGEVPLTIGTGDAARAFTLVFDHEALIAAEAAYRKPLAQTMAEASLGFAGAQGALLFGALRAHHPAVTLPEANRMVLEHGDAVGPAMTAASEASFPKAEAKGDQEGKEPGKEPASPDGARSGGSGAKRGSTPKVSSARPRARSRSKSAHG